MIKFTCDKDAKLFLVEMNMINLLEGATKDFKPDSKMYELFIQRRKKILPGLKDFRRSQLSKQAWRHNRFKIMSGIKKFHSSTKGKRFHRELGRFIATRDVFGSGLLAGSRGNMRQTSETYQDIHETLEFLKVLSSAKTHLLIPYDYYMSVDEYVDYAIFTEEFLITLNKIEEKLLKWDFTFDEDDVDLIYRCLDTRVVIDEIAKATGSDRDRLDEEFGDMDPLSEPFVQKYKKLGNHINKSR